MGSGSSKSGATAGTAAGGVRHQFAAREPRDVEFLEPESTPSGQATQDVRQQRWARRDTVQSFSATAEATRTARLRKKSSKSDGHVDTDEEVDELETTLNSLGVVGRSLWDDAQAYDAVKTTRKSGQGLLFDADDEDPTIARELPVRNIGASSLGVAKTRRNNIEGVDIEKFKAVNSLAESKRQEPPRLLQRSTSDPIDTTPSLPKAVPKYDESDAKLLASIENEFVY
ncbi:unnamed protein product [Notodromas monacha]|uniref:Uncharacterized protein n=1 Tax=Notodromas monacha TaxID=399045 RepID=A0A7R9BC71_9CRUS|nr:unnamed protein product [Notodromas monacha]CAG0912534.1 unnamed protein product [Notodromas monacha]